MDLIMALMLLAPVIVGISEDQIDPQKGWDFAFKDFVIAAWNPPAATDAEYEIYRQAGFNIVMSPRYALPDEALELAQKYSLKLLVDTYTPNEKPWGGTASEYRPHPLHHPATLPELKWLHQRYGDHPALAGYLLGDDYGGLPQELIDTTKFMRENAPYLIPWICQNVMSAESLAKAGNPIMDPQIYPTLYQKDLQVEKQCQLYCDALQKLRMDCLEHNLTPWPMFNVCGVESDSLVRFQIYSSLAYGAQGIWYFTYAGGIQKDRGYETIQEVKQNLLPTWETSARANQQVAEWGEKLLGYTCAGVFHTGWLPSHAAAPGEGKLVEEMSDDLLVGILTKPDEFPIAIVVDKRVDEKFGAIQEREVAVRFASAVTEALAEISISGGGGKLLILKGDGVLELCDDDELSKFTNFLNEEMNLHKSIHTTKDPGIFEALK